MNIFNGDFELIHSSTIIPLDSSPIRVVLTDEVEGDFTLIFHFLTEPGAIAQTKLESNDKFILNIKFINFFGPTYIGNKTPVPIGTLKNLPLFLSYRAINLDDAMPMVHLNFYLGRKN